MAKSVKLKYLNDPENQYHNPYIINTDMERFPTDLVRKEYSRLRQMANNRLKRFEGTEWEDTDVYQINRDKYKPIKEIGSDAELRYRYIEVKRFLEAERGSVSGLARVRAKSITTMRKNGYNFINKANYNSVMRFMNELKAVYSAHRAPSDLLLKYAYYQQSNDEEVENLQHLDPAERSKRMRELYEEWAKVRGVDPYGEQNQKPISEQEIKRRLQQQQEEEILKNGTKEDKKRVRHRQYMREWRKRRRDSGTL